jgi:RimJ/RimL family protein N-acetyltransferase
VIRLRPTAPADLDQVLALERDPANAPFIGQWSLAEHLDAIERADREHWIVGDASGDVVDAASAERTGYLIAYDLRSAGYGVYVKRIVVAAKSRGVGRAALGAFARHAFAELRADSVWLTVFADNLRAQRSYRAAGLEIADLSAAERARRHAAVGGFSHTSLVMMLRATTSTAG